MGTRVTARVCAFARDATNPLYLSRGHVVTMKYSDEFRNKIINELQNGGSIRTVATKFGIGRNTVFRMSNNKYKNKPKKPGPKPSYDDHVVLQIKRWANQQLEAGALINARVCKNELALDLKPWTIRRILTTLGFTYEKVEKILPLTADHKRARVEWAEEHLRTAFDFRTVVFTDEKRFTLDGPDGFMSYSRKGKKVHRIRRQSRGGGVMVWGGMTFDGNFLLFFVPPKYNGVKYAFDLDTIIIPWCKAHFKRKKWVFQQDNSRVHLETKNVKPVFEKNKVNLLDWPARSPDLSPIENIWYWMEREIYKKGQFKRVNELKLAIQDVVEDLKNNHKQIISDLYLGMNGRLLSVIKYKGGVINERN